MYSRKFFIRSTMICKGPGQSLLPAKSAPDRTWSRVTRPNHERKMEIALDN